MPANLHPSAAVRNFLFVSTLSRGSLACSPARIRGFDRRKGGAGFLGSERCSRARHVRGRGLNALSAVLYAGAAGAYLRAGWLTWKILRTRSFRVVDAADRWWPSHRLAEPAHVREQMLDDLAESADLNRGVLDEKGAPLNSLLVFSALEAALVAAAVVASLA